MGTLPHVESLSPKATEPQLTPLAWIKLLHQHCDRDMFATQENVVPVPRSAEQCFYP